jgi:hypothetical protein
MPWIFLVFWMIAFSVLFLNVSGHFCSVALTCVFFICGLIASCIVQSTVVWKEKPWGTPHACDAQMMSDVWLTSISDYLASWVLHTLLTWNATECREHLREGAKSFIFIYVILSLPQLTHNAHIAFLLSRSFNRTTAVFRPVVMGRLCCLTQHERNVYSSRENKEYRLLLVRPVKGKGKAIPLQAWTGPEGSRRLRLPDLKTFGTWRW